MIKRNRLLNRESFIDENGREYYYKIKYNNNKLGIKIQYKTKIFIDDTNEYNNKYYSKNKELINQFIQCECGIKYNKSNKSKHLNTYKHNNLLNNKLIYYNIEKL